MPQFAYKAISPEGKSISGTLEADSAEAAQMLIAHQGNIPTEVKKVAAKNTADGLSFFAGLQRVKLPDLLMFTKQVNTLLRAGLPITRTLEVLKEQTESPVLRQAIVQINEDVNRGESLAKAFAKHPRIFSPLYCNMIAAGEISGSLPEILERLTFIIEHEHKVKEDVKSALTYPKMVILALGGAFFFLLTFVIPKFVTIFEKADLELPLPTKICLLLYNLLAHQWPWLLAGLTLVTLLLGLALRSETGRLVRDRLLLRLPIVGPLFLKTAMSRFSSILAILLASGIPIIEAINVISEAIGNAAITAEFNRIKHHMEEGHGIAAPLRESMFFPPMVVNMIAIGEESGSLEEMLREVARHYDDEVEHAIKNLSEAIAPILIAGLTGVVGFFALAIFLPMWNLTQMAQG